jgi:hypothetical protein
MTSKQLDQITAALAVTLAVLVGRLSDITRRTGGIVEDDRGFDRISRDGLGVQVGDWVIVWAHQRYRIAQVWKVTPTKLSAVYVTPSKLDEATRYGYPVFPNNITARIDDCRLYALDGDSTVATSEQPAAPAPIDEPAQPREIAVDDHAAAAGMLPLAGGDGFLF